MKILAFYLPQYHEIEENNKWWGKGFTEWTNVKKAKPYYKGQYQPKEPLNDNYYDLSSIEPMIWQAKLAKSYGLYGFCFYHYWFNGKLLLEKPLENLLQHKEIDIKYCISWANEPWTRSWSGKSGEILMPQFYGNENDWKNHFYYLLPFFKDQRYITVDNKPMFLIYKSKSIDQCKAMMDCWIELAKKEGFNGIHFVNTIRDKFPDKRNLPFEAKIEFEPARTFNSDSIFYRNYLRIRRIIIRTINFILKKQYPLYNKIHYFKIAQKSIHHLSDKNTYGGVFVGWDNTPRRNHEGLYVTEASKEEFIWYLKEKIKITQDIYKTDFLFINAWNEWCEGAYLEPDKKNSYKFLEAINQVVNEW